MVFLDCLSLRKILLPLLVILFGIAWYAPVIAQTPVAAPNKAGLVIVHEDGSVVSRCVGFPAASISGYDLLVRGGFAPRSEVTSMGASVCSLDGQGCAAGQDCFCQCKSSPCIYWTYWQLLPDGWRYSNAGATSGQVHNGDMQAWVWGESKPNAPAANAPPPLTFADICTADATLFGIDETPAAAPVNTGMTQPWLVALVIGVPLLLGGGLWLFQRRRKVQP
jgi:LPXTG-motif cell wall-anchored protein